jgi:hypothetical protein
MRLIFSPFRYIVASMGHQPQLNWIANFIWGIADDILRDIYVS